MLNPRNTPDDSDPSKDKQKFEEETEYHFSEDEFTYQVENDLKSAEVPTGSTTSKPQTGMQQRLQGWKERFREMNTTRLWMIGAAVLIVFFIIYKVVTPSSSETTNLAMQPIAPSASTRTATHPSMLSQPAIVHKQPELLESSVPVTQGQPENINPQQASTLAPPQEGQVLTPTTMPSSTNMGQVMPVKSGATAIPSGVVPASQVENKLSQVNQSNEAMLNQMQAEYLQRLNDYANQNKNLSEEVKTLTTRVSTLESELNQLLQTLMKSTIAAQANVATLPEVQNTATSTSQAPEVRLPYTVQAIIPGRAWLRNEGGETLTVGEGDNLKEGGRVSKIDPYDGVVEITIGKKTVALSYGNNAEQQ